MATEHDEVGQKRRLEAQRRQKQAVQKRIKSGESKLRVKGDLAKASAAARRKNLEATKRKWGVDPVGVRSLTTGGLPTLGKGRR